MRRVFLLAAACLLCLQAGAWSRRNHEAIAYIAEQHLTPKAASTVKELLHGQSLTYYAGWMDDFREVELIHLPEADEDGNTEIQRVHYFMVDKNLRPLCTPYKDGIWLITNAIENLYNYKQLSDEQRLDYMKVLAHMVADIHCPGHISYADKRDRKLGKYRILDQKGREVPKFHKFLDFTVLDWKFPGGMIDLAYVADPLMRPCPTEADVAYMQKVQDGSAPVWGMEIAASCKDVFQKIPPEHQLTAEELQWLADLEKDQILRAGYRLAKILNGLFGE